MNATLPAPVGRRTSPGPSLGGRARRRMLRPGERPAFLADWVDVLFVHFTVDPEVLRPHVPFELDLFGGRAYVSIVAFTQRGLRPRVGGRLAARLCAPLATHEFLNLRTYVRHKGERGIYFLSEWIPNRLAALIGPRLYGLPYRLGRMRYVAGHVSGEVHTAEGAVTWRARTRLNSVPRPARRGLERFLLDRYTAYTRRGTTCLRFRVWHEPWLRVRARVRLRETALLRAAFQWLGDARPLLAHYSKGVRDVWIGPPRHVDPTGHTLWRSVATWLPSAALLAGAFALGASLPAWAWMWSLCFALFFGCKWVTWVRADATLRWNVRRSLAYFFAWVGMDARAFLDPTYRPGPAPVREWLAVAVKTVVGASLVWGVAPLLLGHEIAGAWVAMIGLVLLLHFGTFHLMSLLWRRAGVDAAPIMRQPARSASLAEFWGARWNVGFHRLAHDLAFRPLRRRLGVAGATLATFAASGLVHDLVISLPAGAGYGLPTAYFLVQGLGVLAERTDVGRRLKGRTLAAAVLLAPLPWLFHRPFVHNVVLPLLDAIGAA